MQAPVNDLVLDCVTSWIASHCWSHRITSHHIASHHISSCLASRLLVSSHLISSILLHHPITHNQFGTKITFLINIQIFGSGPSRIRISDLSYLLYSSPILNSWTSILYCTYCRVDWGNLGSYISMYNILSWYWLILAFILWSKKWLTQQNSDHMCSKWVITTWLFIRILVGCIAQWLLIYNNSIIASHPPWIDPTSVRLEYSRVTF